MNTTIIILTVYFIGILVLGPILRKLILKYVVDNSKYYRARRKEMVKTLLANEEFNKMGCKIEDVDENIFRQTYYSQVKFLLYALVFLWPVTIIAFIILFIKKL